jgi:hypothetical protein
MPQRNRDMARLDDAFERARRELSEIGSVRPQIERRIAEVSMRPPQRVLAWSLAAGVAVAALIALTSWRARTIVSPTPHFPANPVVQTIHYRSLEVGTTKLVEYLATYTDRGSIVVIWTCRGDGVTAMPADATEIPAGKYRLSNLDAVKLADGRILVCSLAIPDTDVHPALEPPSIYARSGDNRITSMSVWPRAASAAELADAIRSADGGQAREDVTDIVREIQKRIHKSG